VLVAKHFDGAPVEDPGSTSWRRSSATLTQRSACLRDDLAKRIAEPAPDKYTIEVGPSPGIGKLFIIISGTAPAPLPSAPARRARKGLLAATPAT
jgi:hypothetical protein